jgi:hypothetical protein
MKYEELDGKTLLIRGLATKLIDNQRSLGVGPVERFGRLTVSPSGKAAKLEPVRAADDAVSPDQLWFVSLEENELKKIVANKGQQSFTYHGQEEVPDLLSLS